MLLFFGVVLGRAYDKAYEGEGASRTRCLAKRAKAPTSVPGYMVWSKLLDGIRGGIGCSPPKPNRACDNPIGVRPT